MRSAGPVLGLLGLLALGCGPGRRSFEEPLTLGGVEVAPAVLNRGEIAYMRYCRGCHGPSGRGNGPYAASMTPRPADLTAGAYPRLTGPEGELPSDAQLRAAIEDGIDGTPMAPLSMAHEDRDAVVQYIKTLAPRWRE